MELLFSVLFLNNQVTLLPKIKDFKKKIKRMIQLICSIQNYLLFFFTTRFTKKISLFKNKLFRMIFYQNLISQKKIKKKNISTPF